MQSQITQFPNPVFLGDWDKSRDVFESFNYHYDGENILFAAYAQDYGYDGTALVIFEKDSKLFEVHGGHCSCNGLENQWSPEESSFLAIKKLIAEKAADLESAFCGEFGKLIAEPIAAWAAEYERLNGEAQ